jgi:hypothetical protein
MEFCFLSSFVCWAISLADIYLHGNIDLPRDYWKSYDATLIGEIFYSYAFVLAFAKLLYFLSTSSDIGPMQVGLCRHGKIFGESLDDAKDRLRAYKAYTSPAYILLAFDDPILAIFNVSNELHDCAEMEKEFRVIHCNFFTFYFLFSLEELILLYCYSILASHIY